MTALLGRATRLRLAKLMLITGARTVTGDLVALASAGFSGGADIVELRDPRAPLAIQTDAVAQVAGLRGRDGLVGAYGADAHAEDADLLQLSALDLAAAALRAALPAGVLLGRSCHSPAQVRAAIAEAELAFFTISPVFNPAGVGEAGLELVAVAAELAPPSQPGSKPWFAVGGINADNLDQVLAAGARRIGVTRAIRDAADPRAASADLDARLRAAWSADPEMERVIFEAYRG